MAAEKINDLLNQKLSVFYSFLSKRGKRIYFPSSGIMAQIKQIKNSKINASIGIALDDKKWAFNLDSVSSHLSLHVDNVFPYAPSFGVKNFRELWLDKILKQNPSINASNITTPIITSGLTHGIKICADLFCDEGQEVLVADLFWGNYKLIFEVNAGAKLNTFPFFKNSKFNLSGLQEILVQRKKTILLVNFPNNPSGYCLTQTEQDELVVILEKYAKDGNELLVICDDAYFGLFFEENIAKESLFSRLSSLHENIFAVKVDGPTKEDYVWGLRVGSLVVGGKSITLETASAIQEKVAGLVRSSISNVSHLSQSLLLKDYQSDTYDSEKKVAFELLESRYAVVRKTLDSHLEYQKVFTVLPFNSGYFICVKLIDGLDCKKVWSMLSLEYGIGLIYFKEENLLRIAFSCLTVEEIPKVFESLFEVCNTLLK